MSAPIKVPVALFFDYGCPYCYLASTRLERLAERHPLDVRWRFLEIHPDVPLAGRPQAALAPEWPQSLAEAAAMAADEQIPFRSPDFVPNTRRALLLAQSALALRPQYFPALHRAIFQAYFVEGRNIGDPEVLQPLARDLGVEELPEVAWGGPAFFKELLKHVEAAQRLGLVSVPALKVGPRVFTGAVSVQTLEAALTQTDAP